MEGVDAAGVAAAGGVLLRSKPPRWRASAGRRSFRTALVNPSATEELGESIVWKRKTPSSL